MPFLIICWAIYVGFCDRVRRTETYSQIRVLLRVERDGADGRHDDQHAQRDGHEEHDDVLCAVQQRVVFRVVGAVIAIVLSFGRGSDLPRPAVSTVSTTLISLWVKRG